MLLIEFNKVPLVKKSKIASIYSSYIHLLSRELQSGPMATIETLG